METNSEELSSDSAASDALRTLSADRSRLVEVIRVPWPLLAGLGAMAAWWVGAAAATSPGEDYEPSSIGGLALAIVLVIIHLIQRETGIRFGSMGLQAGLALTGIAVSNLMLFSLSLGLVSLGLPWAVIITSVMAFALTTWLAGVAYRSAARKLCRG